jgi:hypothetical protein
MLSCHSERSEESLFDLGIGRKKERFFASLRITESLSFSAACEACAIYTRSSTGKDIYTLITLFPPQS